MATPSPRVLGKGRVLGAPKPRPQSTYTATSPLISGTEQKREPDLLSPSASTLSLDSQQDSSRSSNDGADISAAAALQVRDTAATASASARMICPICNEEMVTLLQLNRHLDDAHKNLEEKEQDEVKTWFKSQVVKAKKFQPLAVLNQKFKGLDVFEANEDRRPVSHARASSGSQVSPGPTEPALVRITPQQMDPEDLITKDHWQRYTFNGLCSDPLCGKRLGGVNGNINCRKCGKLFCEEHTMYQMKLSKLAVHEPVRGYWYRACETCYKSREGYNDHNGTERDYLDMYSKHRRKAVDKNYLETSRLEKRLSKLVQILADPNLEPEEGAVAKLWSLSSGTKSQRRLREESIVDWEDDKMVSHCPFCRQEFSQYSFRRHHCRVCGRVICDDPATVCSSKVALNARSQDVTSEKDLTLTAVDVRMCKECRSMVFGKADFAEEVARITPDQKAFQHLKQFERGIKIMLPRFQRLLAALQDPVKPPSPAQLSEATKVRKRLTDSFTQYDIAARRIRDILSTGTTQLKLQNQVYLQATQFLHLHMLPLKALPKILKHASPHGRSASGSSIVNGHLAPGTSGRSPLSVIQRNESPGPETSSQQSSSRLSELETEEKSVREQLIVLEEQKFLVNEMLADARRRRKFEEANSLARNFDDLTKECDRLQSVLSGLKVQVEEEWLGGPYQTP